MNNAGRALLRPHDPFDDSAAERHRRMGLLTADSRADNAAMKVFSQIYAGLFYDSLCDFSGSFETVRTVCSRLLELSGEEPRRVLLALSMQYDTMRRALPEPVWWIAGSKVLLPVFASGFLEDLRVLLQESEGIDHASH